MTGYTPAPWEILSSLDGKGWKTIRSDDDGVIVADVQYSEDARLISAAPELLEAVKILRRELHILAAGFSRADDAISLADEAIAKAKGETE